MSGTKVYLLEIDVVFNKYDCASSCELLLECTEKMTPIRVTAKELLILSSLLPSSPELWQLEIAIPIYGASHLHSQTHYLIRRLSFRIMSRYIGRYKTQGHKGTILSKYRKIWI